MLPVGLGSQEHIRHIDLLRMGVLGADYAPLQEAPNFRIKDFRRNLIKSVFPRHLLLNWGKITQEDHSIPNFSKIEQCYLPEWL